MTETTQIVVTESSAVCYVECCVYTMNYVGKQKQCKGERNVLAERGAGLSGFSDQPHKNALAKNGNETHPKRLKKDMHR